MLCLQKVLHSTGMAIIYHQLMTSYEDGHNTSHKVVEQLVLLSDSKFSGTISGLYIFEHLQLRLYSPN